MRKIIAVTLIAFATQGVFAQGTPDTSRMKKDPSVNHHNTTQNAVTDLKQNGNTIDYANRQAMQAQVNDVPESARTMFNQKYNGKTATWYSSESGYWATYPGTNSMNEQVIFDASGKMTGTGRQVKSDMLPKSSNEYLKTNFKDINYQDVYMITPVNGDPYYEVYVKDRWVQFDNKGNYVPFK